MQPETAFWVLSATAQSAAALAGLSALLLVFVLRETKRDTKAADFFEAAGTEVSVGGWPMYGLMSVGTLLYLVAVITSLVALGQVTPGPTPVGLYVEISIFVSIGLFGAGSLALVLFIWRPEKWLFEQIQA